MAAPVEVRRFLHVNYNCTDIELLEQFYVGTLGLKTVMKSESSGGNATPFGMFGIESASKATFVYDHRGGKWSNAFELVQWVQPQTIGAVYPSPWCRGIQSSAYSAEDLDGVATRAVQLGGAVVRRGTTWVLLTDPEGAYVEVQQAAGLSEAKYLRIVCSDLQRSVQWWQGIGFTPTDLPSPPTGEIWPETDGRVVTAEQAMVPTDDRFGIILTTWSGDTPIGPTYAMPYHQGLYRMAMAVDDARGAAATLVDNGVGRQNYYTFQLPGTKLTDGLTMVFIRDPDGILVELVDRPRIGPRPV